MDAEWNILYDKLEKIYKSGAKVVLSKLPIGDVATQYFADRDLFCAGRVQEEDLKRTMMVGHKQKQTLNFLLLHSLRRKLNDEKTCQTICEYLHYGYDFQLLLSLHQTN